MGGVILGAALLVLGALPPSAGIEASPRRPTLAQVPSDEVSLLQAQVEVRRAEALGAQRTAAVEEEAGPTAPTLQYNLQASCAASSSTCGHEPPATFKLQFPAGAPAEQPVRSAPPAEADAQSAAPVAVEEASAPEAADQAAGAEKFPVVAVTLEVLVCLLVADAIRRYGAKGEDTKGLLGEQSKQAPARADGGSLLLAAALAGDEAAFEAELVCGGEAQLLQVDTWGCTPLHYAAKGGSVRVVERLLDLGAKVEALDAWDETPLHIAARAGHGEVCKALLAAGACLNATNAEDCTPLVVGGRAGQEAVCRFLIGHGAGVAGLLDEQVPGLVAGLLLQQVLAGAAPLGAEPPEDALRRR